MFKSRKFKLNYEQFQLIYFLPETPALSAGTDLI